MFKGVPITLVSKYSYEMNNSALSMIQNGKLLRVLTPELMEELFNSGNPRTFINDLRRGLDALSLYTVRSL